MRIDSALLDSLTDQAKASERQRMNYDLRTSAEDGSQHMLNALLPGTEVAVHRHPMSNESVLILAGRLDEVIFEETGERVLREKERYHLCPAEGFTAVSSLPVHGIPLRSSSLRSSLRRRTGSTARMGVRGGGTNCAWLKKD